MSEFGNTLFGGSRFVRWSLTPVILFFALWMPTMTHQMAPTGMPILIGMEIAFVAMLAGFWLPAKIGRWCFRVLTALVFLACTIFVVDAFSSTKKPASAFQRASRQSPYRSLPALLFIGFPCLWFTLTGRFSIKPQVPPEQLAAEAAAQRKAFEASLLQPDWSFYERHLQRPAPDALKSLYADEKLITSSLLDYSDHCSVNTFEPLNEQNLIDAPEAFDFPIMPIATNDYGDPIYLKPGSSEADAVYVTWHDGGDTEVLADSVATFAKRLRRANKLTE